MRNVKASEKYVSMRVKMCFKEEKMNIYLYIYMYVSMYVCMYVCM